MEIADKELEQLAQLANLTFDQREAERLKSDMETIIQYFADKFSELDTENVAPMEHVLQTRNVFREDEPTVSTEREKMLKNASEKENGYFKVPKVMDGN